MRAVIVVEIVLIHSDHRKLVREPGVAGEVDLRRANRSVCLVRLVRRRSLRCRARRGFVLQARFGLRCPLCGAFRVQLKRRLRGGGKRQCKTEPRSAAGRSLGPNASTVREDDSLGYVESETGAVLTGVAAPETVEHVG